MRIPIALCFPVGRKEQVLTSRSFDFIENNLSATEIGQESKLGNAIYV